MKVLYYNCSLGISDDMNLSALINLGMPLDYLLEELEKLNIAGYTLDVFTRTENTIKGTFFRVLSEDDYSKLQEEENPSSTSINTSIPRRKETIDFKKSLSIKERRFFKFQRKYYIHRHYAALRHHMYISAYRKTMALNRANTHKYFKHNDSAWSYEDIKSLVVDSDIRENAKRIALSVFDKIAHAEAELYIKDAENIVLYEIDSLDAVISVIASAIALDYFNVDRVCSSVVELGGGIMRTKHGVLPIPTPVTALLATQFISSLNGLAFEATNSIGAAIISATADSFEEQVSGKIISQGLGFKNVNSSVLSSILQVSLLEVD